MKTKRTPRAKDSFWQVVEDCLEEIHNLPRTDAHARSTDLRKRVERHPRGISGEIIYHAEPFDVACDIAGNQLDLSQFRNQYDAILNRHNW